MIPALMVSMVIRLAYAVLRRRAKSATVMATLIRTLYRIAIPRLEIASSVSTIRETAPTISANSAKLGTMVMRRHTRNPDASVSFLGDRSHNFKKCCMRNFLRNLHSRSPPPSSAYNQSQHILSLQRVTVTKMGRTPWFQPPPPSRAMNAASVSVVQTLLV